MKPLFGWLPTQAQIRLILGINRLRANATERAAFQQQIKTSLKVGFDWEIDTLKDFLKRGPALEISGKRILDFGCGLGGATDYFAQQGASLSVGVDLNRPSLDEIVTLFANDPALSVARTPLLANADGARLPFSDNTFDLISSIYVFEHVGDVAGVMSECHRTLKTGGKLFIVFPPYYSPWCAHTDDWLAFPWPHVLFSERAIAKAVAIVDAQKHNMAHYNAHAQFPIKPVFDHVNRLLLAEFEAIFAKHQWSNIDHRLPAVAEGSSVAWIGKILQALNRELFTSTVICTLTK